MASLETEEVEEITTDPTAPGEGPVDVFIYSPPETRNEQLQEVFDNGIEATPDALPIYTWSEPSVEGRRPIRTGC